MTNPPITIHIGLPSAGGSVLQSEYFTKAEGLNYLGRKGGDRRADAVLRNLGLLADAQLDLPALRAEFAGRIAGDTRPALASVDILSSWKSYSPLDLGRRTAAVFGPPRVLFVTRRPTEWAIAQYQTRVMACQRDTFAGMNPWLEKHLSQLRVGSDLGAAAFGQTLDLFCEGSAASEVLVAAYEELERDRRSFLDRIDTFLQLDGALGKLADGPEPDLAPPSRAMLNYARVLSLFDRDRPRFFEIADALAAGVPHFFRTPFDELRANSDAKLEAWIAWFRNSQKAVFKAIQRGGGALAEMIDIFAEAPVRSGLLAHLSEIEAQETERMLVGRGIDLRPFGYLDAPPEEETPPSTGGRRRLSGRA